VCGITGVKKKCTIILAQEIAVRRSVPPCAGGIGAYPSVERESVVQGIYFAISKFGDGVVRHSKFLSLYPGQ
jgi:hypothetical protein